jgi:hypothetical protein
MAIYRGPGGSGDATTDATNQASVASDAAAAALVSQTAAANSATNAATSATAAASSASGASTSATNAANSATSAASSASTATTQAGIATTQATNAATSATNAATSAANAATTYDNFDDRYLGSKASAPTLDNDGNALLTGALYWNSTTSIMYAWSGSTWSAISGGGGSGVSSFNTRTGAVTLSSSDVTTALTYTPLNPANNLSEVTASTARTNLSVPSTTGSGATGTWNIDVLGNAGTVTNGVYTTGNQTIGGTKTFSSTISGSIDGNAATVTNGFYTTSSFNLGTTSVAVNRASGAQTLTGVSIDGNAGTVTNGVYTTGSYSNPSWITSLSETKVLPSQTGNSGKYLTTNGTSTSWATVTGGGASALDDLTDVTITSPAAGQVLKYNGSVWINDTDSTGSGSFAYPTGTGIVTVSSGSAWGTTLTAPTGTIVGTSDTQTLTNKTISGTNNTLSDIANSSLTNSSITINGTATSLGGSISVGTVTSVSASVPTGFSISGSPITSSGTLGITFSAGYSLPTTSSQTNWDTAFTDRLKWDGGSTGLTASTGRTSLGATTVGSNLFTLTNPSAITFPRFNADNTVSTLNATNFRTAIGAGTVTNLIHSVAAAGTDIASSVSDGTTAPNIILNIPTASATNRGALSSTDWSTFNNKQAALVSGTNIKTVNGTTLLGSGDLGTIVSGYGGTGFSTYTTGDLIYASATNTLSKLSAGTNGHVLTLASGVPTWAASSGSMVYPSAGIAVSTGSAWGTSLTAPTGTIVGTTDTQTLSGKTLTNPTVNNYVEGVVAIGTVTTAHTLDLTNGTVQTATLTASTACTFTMPTATAGKSFILYLKQAATTGNGTATFTSVKWTTTPTVTATAGKMDIFSFFADGTNWYGVTVGQGYTP